MEIIEEKRPPGDALTGKWVPVRKNVHQKDQKNKETCIIYTYFAIYIYIYIEREYIYIYIYILYLYIHM